MRHLCYPTSGAPCRAEPSLLCFREVGVIRRIRTSIQSLIGISVVAGGAVIFAPAASAISIPVACSQGALVAAVTQANSTVAGDTLVLASGCTYHMTLPSGG